MSNSASGDTGVASQKALQPFELNSPSGFYSQHHAGWVLYQGSDLAANGIVREGFDVNPPTVRLLACPAMVCSRAKQFIVAREVRRGAFRRGNCRRREAEKFFPPPKPPLAWSVCNPHPRPLVD